MVAETIDVGGHAIEYVDLPGDGALAPLVFLHEGLGSVGLWRDFPERLAERTGRRAVVYSRWGHGGSDAPPAPRDTRFMHDEATEVLPALLAELGVGRPLLVSHSDGASIALLHAAVHDVEGVVAMAPHVFVEPESIDGITAAREAFRTGGLRARMARHHRDPDVTFAGWNDVWLSAAFRDWDITADVGSLSCPLLLVQGETDQYGTLAQIDAIAGAVVGPVERLVLDCGHAPHLERPEATLDALTAFAAARG